MSDNKPEVEVSDIANEVQEPVTISVTDLLSQVSGGDLNQANKTFAELIGDRVNDALEAEKVKVAGEIYNDQERDDDVSEEDVEAALAELDAEDADGTGADEVVGEVEDGTEDDGPEAEAHSVESEESPEAEEVVEPVDEVPSEAVSDDSGSDSFDLGSEEEHAELEDPFESAGQEVDEILASEDEEVVPSEE